MDVRNPKFQKRLIVDQAKDPSLAVTWQLKDIIAYLMNNHYFFLILFIFFILNNGYVSKPLFKIELYNDTRMPCHLLVPQEFLNENHSVNTI